MLKLLIVDDDEWILEGMKRNIPWAESGIDVVGTASNGKEGWELVQSLRPDLILTDIRMPFMDGLQLAELVAGEYPGTKVIFLTGYDDFTYAKKALQLRASDYILKYEENHTILEAVVRAAEALEEERRTTETKRKSKDLIENRFLCDLLTGTVSMEWVRSEAELLGLPVKGPFFCAAVIQAEGVKRFTKPHAPDNTELLLFSIRNICSELYPGGERGIYFANYNQRINILFQLDSSPGEEERRCDSLEPVLAQIRKSIEGALKIPVSIGVGRIYEGVEWLPVSYNEALSAVQMKDVMGAAGAGMGAGSGIIYSGEVRYSQSSHQALLNRVTEYINQHYARDDLSLTRMAEEVHMTPAYVSTLFKKYKEMTMMDYLTGIRLEKSKELLANTDLKSYEVAEKVGYSNPQYFSVLFKKNTGLSPMEYRQKLQDGH